MPCPFLARLSPNYVRNYGPTLLKMYGSQCPIISRSLKSLEHGEPLEGHVTDGKILSLQMFYIYV